MSGMPVSEPPPRDVVAKALTAWRHSDVLRRWGRKVDGLLPAHRVFTIGLRALAEPTNIAELAEPVGWQFIVPRRGEPIAIEVSDGDLQVEIESGPQVHGASEIFGSDDETPREDVAVRMLRVPEMGLMAVWFQPLHGEDGVIVPLDPAPQQFTPLEEYPAGDFLEQAAGAARRRLEFYAEPGAGEKGG